MRYVLALIVLGAGLTFSASAARAGDTFDYWDRHPQPIPALTTERVTAPIAPGGSNTAIAGSTSTVKVPPEPGKSH